MKRILFTLLMAVVLFGGIAVECAEAGKRKYNIKYCSRDRLWKDILLDIRWSAPKLKRFLDENIKPVNQDPQLSPDDHMILEQFDKKLRWYVSECLLLMKEINILIKEVHRVNPEQDFFIAINIHKTLVKNNIPFIENRSEQKYYIFSFNLSPFLSKQPF